MKKLNSLAVLATLSLSVFLTSCGDNSVSQEAQSDISVVSSELVGTTRKFWENGTTLTVGFLDGTKKQQQFVIDTAKEWSRYANINFQVVHEIGKKQDIKRQKAQIRISFVGNGKNTSFVGTDALVHYNDQARFTMSLADVKKESRTNYYIVLHEFGHVLGLQHEHVSPVRELDFDMENIYQNCKRLLKLPEASCRVHVATALEDEGLTRSEEYDRHSVMGYIFTPAFYRNKGAKRSMPIQALSLTDKLSISDIYPGKATKENIMVAHLQDMKKLEVHNDCKIISYDRPDVNNAMKAQCSKGDYAIGIYNKRAKGYTLLEGTCGSNFNDQMFEMLEHQKCQGGLSRIFN